MDLDWTGWETGGDFLPHLAWVQISTPVRGGADSVQPGLPTGGCIVHVSISGRAFQALYPTPVETE